MNLTKLIEHAKAKSGMTLGQMAQEMEVKQSAITAWKKGEYKPGTGEIAYLASKAGLPVLETVAEIEAERDSRYAPIWQAALGKLKAAGVTAAVIVAVAAGSLTATNDAFSAEIRGSKTSVSAKDKFKYFQKSPENLQKTPAVQKTAGVFCWPFVKSKQKLTQDKKFVTLETSLFLQDGSRV